MKYRLPKIIKFPFGFTVTIERKNIEEHGLWYYDLSGKGKIILNKKDSLPVQYNVLAHELIHAANDFQHWVAIKVTTPMEIEMGESISALEEEEED